MNREIITAENLTDEQIKVMFSDYVTSHESEERHTDSACDEAESFGRYCEDTFQGEARLQNDVYDKMMDVAVSFEESGFVAGVKWALDLIRRGLLVPPAEDKGNISHT